MGTSLGEGYWFTGSGYWFWRKGGLLVTGCGYWFWLLVLEEMNVLALVIGSGYWLHDPGEGGAQALEGRRAREGPGRPWQRKFGGRGEGGFGSRFSPGLQKFKPKGLGIVEDDSVSE